MAFNGSGTFVLYSPGNPVVTGTTISSTWANNTLSDIATGLSTCITKDGQTTPTANIPMGGFKLTGLAAGTSNGDSLRYEQVVGAYIPNTLLTTTGDMIYASAANTPARLAIGTAGQVQTVNAGATAPRYVSALPKLIYGLTYANNGSDATNDIDIAVGGCMDATGVYWMTSAALTKQSDAAWAVGTNAGWLDTGAIGNNDYYIWTIARSDTGVVDSLLSLSSTAPTMPANYDYKRLIGWIKRVGGAIVAFKTYETEGGGIEMKWSAPTHDVNLTNTLTTSRRTDAVKVPLNFSTTAILRVSMYDSSASFTANICCPDETDVAPDTNNAPGANMYQATTTPGAGSVITEHRIRTSSTGTVAARATISTVDQYNVFTLGFIWSRRN